MVTHAFTVDLEDWFQGIELPPADWAGREDRLERGLDALLAILDAAGVRATFFVLGWIAGRKPDVVRRLAEAGHEIGSHGPRHEKVYDLSPDAFQRDEAGTKARIEDLTGSPVRGYRAPFFSITAQSLWALDGLAALGYTYDCSISPAVTWRYGIAGAPEGIYRLASSGLIEFTVSTWRLFGRRFGAGGAYFRIFPSFLTSRPFGEGNRTGRPAMFYTHPWEYDPDHPVIDFERKARFTHYHNLRATVRRTRRLLARYRFGTAADAIATAAEAGAIPVISESAIFRSNAP